MRELSIRNGLRSSSGQDTSFSARRSWVRFPYGVFFAIRWTSAPPDGRSRSRKGRFWRNTELTKPDPFGGFLTAYGGLQDLLCSSSGQDACLSSKRDGFDSRTEYSVGVVQLVERRSEEPGVAGSIPASGTTRRELFSSYPHRPQPLAFLPPPKSFRRRTRRSRQPSPRPASQRAGGLVRGR